VPGHDVKTMAARALEIVTDPHRREQMGIAARERASPPSVARRSSPLRRPLPTRPGKYVKERQVMGSRWSMGKVSHPPTPKIADCFRKGPPTGGA